MAITFRRARTEEQRDIRRRAILGTAAAMLEEMPVAEVSLNELSRRVRLAKSNVLRYFESREAVLLELLDAGWRQWMDELSVDLVAEAPPDTSPRARGDHFALVFARTLASRRVLCDLLSAQAGVLEHNISTAHAARYKRTMLDNTATLATVLCSHLPELGGQATKVAGAAVLVAGAAWTHTHPAPSMIPVIEGAPCVAVLSTDFTVVVSDTLATLITGTLARMTV